MSEHTKLPYKVDERVWIVGPDDNQAIVKCMGLDDSIREANAAFIVTACNSFDALVEALNGSTKMLSLLETVYEKPDGRKAINDQLKLNDDALALAQQGRT